MERSKKKKPHMELCTRIAYIALGTEGCVCVRARVCVCVFPLF